jgi:hypothetical protein
MLSFEDAAPLLRAVGMAQASEEALDIPYLAEDLGRAEDVVFSQIEQLEAWGLVLISAEPEPPILLDAGKQYLRVSGAVEADTLRFLPRIFDDLNARRAVLHGGALLIDEFSYEVAHGRATEHARELVPPAFAESVDDRLAVDMFAAAVALMSRLASGSPAGCVAEEIIAFRVIEEAHAWLEMQADLGELESDATEDAASELESLFELFQDDDVRDLFDMKEPADAALRGHDPISRQLGVADQRIEAWFEPFWGLPATGHLARASDRADGRRDLPERLVTVVEPADANPGAKPCAGEFRVCIRIWEAEFDERDEFDQMPDTWLYYIEASTAHEAEKLAFEQFPNGARLSPGLDDETVGRSSDVARLSVDVQRIGLPQGMKATTGDFHIVGVVDLQDEQLAHLAAHLASWFPVALVAYDSVHQFVGVSVHAESYEEAEADLEDVLQRFADSAGLDEVLLDQSCCGRGSRDPESLLVEIERFRPSPPPDISA